MLPEYWTTFIACGLFVLWQPNFSGSNTVEEKYETEDDRIIPAGAFSIIWAILYGLMTFSLFNYLEFSTIATAGTWNIYDGVVILYGINILLNKSWMPLFFGKWGMTGKVLALVVNILMAGTGITILVFTAYQGMWLPFGLWAPYVLWNLIAIWLNVRALNTE